MNENICKINDAIEQLYAIELLEYHNKNFLVSKIDNKTWSEWKLDLYNQALEYCKVEGKSFNRAQV